jgi:hypothetical protein
VKDILILRGAYRRKTYAESGFNSGRDDRKTDEGSQTPKAREVRRRAAKISDQERQ